MNDQCGEMNRRGFISGIIPGCALTCLAFRSAEAATYGSCLDADRARDAGGEQQEVHKFDQPRLPARTHRQLEEMKIARFLEFAEFLSDRMSRKEVIGLLKDFQSQRQVPQARSAVERLGSNDLAAFKRFYDPSIPGLARIVTMEIVESTDTVYEWKITECLNTIPYLRAGAPDLGYAAACFGDYAFAESFNPSIKLIRDRTIMQGDAYCNHRYVYTG
jgi:hypothetical protein